ncbi:MAG TPA: adenylate/guanylate cyclase domain-containing protein [Rubricoccaceae bacterium]|nr:adenylate/guanylate cyclase domain-containing protein [Rubricoccaceae bacterium]
MEATLKILFVDDEPDLAPLIRQKFRRHVREGLLALDFASDGVEALEKLDQHPDIELVVTDLNMPRMDGLTLLRHLREREREHKAIVVTAYGDMENIRTAMNQGAFDFLTKPIDLGDLEVTINNAREIVDREREASVVRQAFGRYLSDKIAQAILSDPGALSLGGERREVSVLMSDLSGFSALSERLEPERVVELLNLYLGKMTEVIDAYDGTIDEFIGDAILVIFGAPIARSDHAERAVACAVAMQRAMADVNAALAERGLPALAMGIGLNTGEVVVGNIGSEKRAKYGVVGSPVNLTSRIQTLAASGEVVITTATREAAGPTVRIASTREVAMKGFAEPITVHFVEGVGGDYDLALPQTDAEPLVPLAVPIPCHYTPLDGKQLVGEPRRAEIVRLSSTHAIVLTATSVPPRSDVRLTIPLSPEAEATAELYAKVVEAESSSVGGPMLTVHFAGVPAEAAEALARYRAVGLTPGPAQGGAPPEGALAPSSAEAAADAGGSAAPL